MENKSHAWAAGLFVIGLLTLLIAMTLWLSRDTRERDLYDLSTSEAVTGLSEQAAVRFKGIAVGKVVHIGFDPQAKGKVLLRIAIDPGLPLTQATYGTLAYQGVTGLAFVQLDDDGSSAEALATRNDQPTRIPLRPGLLSQFADQGSFLLQQAQRITERVDSLLSAENQATMVHTLAAVGRSAESLAQAATRMQTAFDAQLGPQHTDVPALVKDAQRTLQALQATAVDISSTAQASTQLAKSVTLSAQSLQQLTQRLNAEQGLLTQLERSAQALSASATTVQTSALPGLIEATARTAQAAQAITATSQGVSQLTRQLSDNPQSLLAGAAPGEPGPGEPGFAAPAATLPR